MKRFALSLSLPVLGALAFAMACSDTTSPDPHSALRPGTPNPALQGNLPPPPTRTAVDVSVTTTGGAAPLALTANIPLTLHAVFTGVYFANPSLESAAAAGDVGDLSLLTAAWLRLDNKQTGVNSVSANARFQLTDQKSSGHGTLFISDGVVTHTVVIGAVTWDFANPSCDAIFLVCARIRFDATVDGNPASGTADAFGCELQTGDGGQFYYCPIGSEG
jgi:hypothetical protein